MSKEEKNVPEQQPETYQSILGDVIPVDADLMEDSSETDAAETADAPAKPKSSKKKILSIAGITAASVALVGSLTVAGIMLYNKNRPQDAASTPENVYDTKIAACYYHDMLNMLLESYGEENLKATYGLDTSKSLKEQDGPYGDGTSWFDFVLEQTQSTMEQQITVYEAAVNAGFTMPEDMKAKMEEALANADVTEYGNNVTIDDIRKVMEMQALSNAYYLHMLEESAPTDEEIEAYYEANAMNFQSCGLGGFSVSYATADSTSEEEQMTQAEAKAYADALCAAKTKKAFEDVVVKVLKEEEGKPQEEIDAELPTIYTDSYTYTAGNELSEWAFGGAKVGDTYMIETSDTYYIYIMTREPSRDESTTVNVRHILFMNQEDNMAAAEDALEEWKNGEATEESFAELANQYSEDGGSNTNGGLYEGVYQGQMVPTFNDWCFDESRKPGDTGLVESDYGVHVMYFSGQADPTWKKNIESMLAQQSYTDWYSEQAALYPVTFDLDVLNSIEG